eukprot:352834-Chlamydomonas_euryale.AAC.10
MCRSCVSSWACEGREGASVQLQCCHDLVKEKGDSVYARIVQAKMSASTISAVDLSSSIMCSCGECRVSHAWPTSCPAALRPRSAEKPV